MKIISPGKISGEIFSLIDETDEFLVLVSPYIQISGWNKFTSRLKNIKNRNVSLEIFVRDGQKNLKSIDELRERGIQPFLIPNLHSKLYFNEKAAITTSMNLLRSSDQNSLEIGHLSETEDEYEQIVNYYKRHIKPHKSNKSDFDLTLEDEIISRMQELGRVRISLNYNYLKINTERNQYEVRIDRDQLGQKVLAISSILATKEYEQRNELLSKYQFPENLDIEFSKGENRQYDSVFGITNHLINSSQISNVLNSEKKTIAKLIASFVKNIESFKT